MKTMMSLCAVLWASSAFAAGAPEPKDDEKSIEKQGGKFSLLSTECKAEDEAGPETTPGAPPLDIDDPATPGCNAWEVNVVTSGELGKSQSFVTPLLDINYGIGDNVQLKVEAPYEFTRLDGTSHGGVGAAEVGIKHRFFHDESRDMNIAVYPQVEFALPGTAAADEDAATVFKLPFLLSTKVGETGKGDVMLTANVGYYGSGNADFGHHVAAALGIGFPLTSGTALMLEATTEQALTSDMAGVRESVFKANAGVLGKLTDHLMWFGAVGESYASSGEADDAAHTCLVLGVRVLAGGP